MSKQPNPPPPPVSMRPPPPPLPPALPPVRSESLKNDSLKRMVRNSEVADFDRVAAWARSHPRKPAVLAFTAGPERQAAYWIEWTELTGTDKAKKK